MTSPPSPKPAPSKPKRNKAPPPPVVKKPPVDRKPEVGEERLEHMKKMSELKTLMPDTESQYYNKLVNKLFYYMIQNYTLYDLVKKQINMTKYLLQCNIINGRTIAPIEYHLHNLPQDFFPECYLHRSNKSRALRETVVTKNLF